MKTRSRVVWITGASTGIGRSLALHFARKGDVVVASARSTSALHSLESEIREANGLCEVVTCDLREQDAVKHTVHHINGTLGHVDVLLNNAGITYFKNFLETSADEFDNAIATNLRGTFLATKSVLPGMLQAKSGTVINILSYAVKQVYTQSAAYAASKAGIEAMMNVLRAEVRPQGIRIVNVYPGAVRTPIWSPVQQEKSGSQMLHPGDLADLIYQVSQQPPHLMVEELVLRPQGGDLHE